MLIDHRISGCPSYLVKKRIEIVRIFDSECGYDHIF